MGQRLNIEIHENGKLLANAYYHWSGYTERAIELTNTILTKYNEMINEGGLAAAIKLLQSTGAKIELDELLDAGVNIELAHVFSDGANRDNGFIAFSGKRMEETRYWEEGRVTIDIGTKIIDFDCWCRWDPEDWEGSTFDRVEVPYYSHAIPFSDFFDFAIYIGNTAGKRYTFLDGEEYMGIY